MPSADNNMSNTNNNNHNNNSDNNNIMNNNNVNNNSASAAAAIAPADQVVNQGVANNPGAVSLENRATPSIRTNNLNLQFRNDLYDRVNNSSAYDVPRSIRSSLGMRRSNLQLDLHAANRLRCANGGKNVGINMIRENNNNLMCRQRSFDDTESHHYYNLNYGSNSAMRYENIYEQIHDEPLYRNGTVNGSTANSRLYGRLNVIGHGIGRIERHLSSSCGNIDHYNLGGHYAVLGHSHFGTVGHIRLNTNGTGINSNGFMTNQANNSSGNQHKDNYVKTSTSSFFSCLGGENSQSMNNIYRSTSANNGNSTSTTNSYLSSSINSSRSNTPNLSNGSSISRNTGAIPKTKLGKISSANSNNISLTSTQSSAKSASKGTAQSTQNAIHNPEHSSTLNRISKSSLQWLLVNKWLPLWMGQGPDCKVIDFNFMFSRNCDGCEYNTAQKTLANANAVQHQDIIKYNGRQHEILSGNTATTRRGCSLNTIRPLPTNLSRLRESEYGLNSLRRNGCTTEESNYENVHVHFQNGFEFGKSRENYDYVKPPMLRARSESPTFSQRVCGKHGHNNNVGYSDPFKNYELNAENNTFKPQKKESNTTKISKFKVNEGASTSNGLSPISKKEPSKYSNAGKTDVYNNFDRKLSNSINDNNKQINNDFSESKLFNEMNEDKSVKLNLREADIDTITGSTASPEFTYNEGFDEDSDTYEEFDSLKDGTNTAVVQNEIENKAQNKSDTANLKETMPTKDETENIDKVDDNF